MGYRGGEMNDINGALCLILVVAIPILVIICPVAMAWVGMW